MSADRKINASAVILVACIMLALAPMANAATLISHYTFDGNVNNQVGGAPNGTIVGSNVTFIAGPNAIAPNAISLPGGSGSSGTGAPTGYVNLGTQGHPNSAAGIFSGSVAFWIRTTTNDSNASVLGNANDGGNELFQLSVNQGTAQGLVGLDFRAAGGSHSTPRVTAVNGGATVKDGQWHHYVQTWEVVSNLVTSTIYIDGAPVTVSYGTQNDLPAFNPWQYDMTLGASNNRGTVFRGLDGDLADLRIYSGVLTQGEVNALLVPEPASLALVGLGGLLLLRRRR